MTKWNIWTNSEINEYLSYVVSDVKCGILIQIIKFVLVNKYNRFELTGGYL